MCWAWKIRRWKSEQKRKEAKKMARGKVIDKAAADLVLQMKERNPKLTTEQIAAVMDFDATTAGRIIRCGSWEAFCEWKAEKAKKERERNRATAEEPEAEEQIPGQICMELEPKQEMSEQTKLMRFQAAQVDKLVLKLDHINDTLNMILRAVRKE